MNGPLVSFVLPSYNAAKTIDSAIRSIFRQSYTNFEVVFVDGNSDDGTMSIISNYKKQYGKVTVLQERDKGIYDAMNKGIKLAKGEYLIFLGCDDKLYSDDSLDLIMSALQSNPCDVLYGNVFSTRFSGVYDGEFDTGKLYNRNICHQSILFSKKVFSVAGNFNLKYKAHADWEHNIRWFFNSSITKRYVDLIFSDYADGGFSSMTSDDSFLLDKDEIFLKNAFWKLESKNRIRLLKSVVYKKYHLNPLFKTLLKMFKSLSPR